MFRVLEIKSPDVLHELAKRGGFAHEMADLQLIEDADITPQQAFAMAWYVMYCTSTTALNEAGLSATKIEAARLLGVSRPTLDKWLADKRLAENGIQRVIDGRFTELMARGLDRLEYIITNLASNDGAAISAIRAVADIDAARRGAVGPGGVQVNIDQSDRRQLTINSGDVVKARQEVDEWEKARFIDNGRTASE